MQCFYMKGRLKDFATIIVKNLIFMHFSTVKTKCFIHIVLFALCMKSCLRKRKRLCISISLISLKYKVDRFLINLFRTIKMRNRNVSCATVSFVISSLLCRFFMLFGSLRKKLFCAFLWSFFCKRLSHFLSLSLSLSPSVFSEFRLSSRAKFHHQGIINKLKCTRFETQG